MGFWPRSIPHGYGCQKPDITSHWVVFGCQADRRVWLGGVHLPKLEKGVREVDVPAPVSEGWNFGLRSFLARNRAYTSSGTSFHKAHTPFGNNLNGCCIVVPVQNNHAPRCHLFMRCFGICIQVELLLVHDLRTIFSALESRFLAFSEEV